MPMTSAPKLPEDDLDPSEFLLAEFHESCRHYLEVEGRMHDLLKFVSTLVLGLMAASAAYLRSHLDSTAFVVVSSTTTTQLLSYVWIGYVFIGTLLLGYYVELRQRKILVVDQIAAIRQWFSEVAPQMESVLLLVTGVKKSPPYLRRPSAEWYAVLTMATVNSAALFLACGACYRAALSPGCASAAAGIVALSYGLLVFVLATRYAYANDLRRARKHGQSEYALFPHGESDVIPLKWLNRLAGRVERRQENEFNE